MAVSISVLGFDRHLVSGTGTWDSVSCPLYWRDKTSLFSPTFVSEFVPGPTVGPRRSVGDTLTSTQGWERLDPYKSMSSSYLCG